MNSAVYRKSAGTGLIRGTLFTLIGFCLWQAAEFLQCIGFSGTDVASAAAAVTAIGMLIILTAGFGSWAVMDLCRKYSERNLGNSLTVFRMLSGCFTLGTGFAFAALSILFSDSIASFLLLNSDTGQMSVLAKAIVFQAPAWLLIPMLFQCRAFDEGIGKHSINVLSQILENGSRLLLALLILISTRSTGNASRLVYLISASTWIAALPAVVLYAVSDLKNEEELAVRWEQTAKAETSRRILYRWTAPAAESTICGIMIALPAVLSIPLILYTASCTSMPYVEAEEVMQIISFYGRGLCGIGTAVCAAAAGKRLLPGLDPKERKQKSIAARRIERYFCAVLYAVIPCVLFGNWFGSAAGSALFHVSADTSSWFCISAIQGMLDTAAAASMLQTMAMRKRKEAAGYLCLGFAARYISWFLLMKFQGFSAAMVSGWIGSSVTAYLCIVLIMNRYEIRLRSFLIKTACMIYAALCMNGVLVVYKLLSGNTAPANLPAWLQMMVAAAAAAAVYLLVTWLLKITEAVFGKK